MQYEKTSILLEAKNISFRYRKDTPWVLKNINFTVKAGERVALVGPSGSGKSTLAKILAGYETPIQGEAFWNGGALKKKGYCPIQLIGQHPEKAVNPRWKMGKILRECWEPEEELLQKMGIDPSWMTRWPIELSGGELQRFCIARVLGPETKFLICDEISTMLDVITQAQIWQVVLEHTKKCGMGLLVITHNLALAKRICTRIVEFSELNQLEL